MRMRELAYYAKSSIGFEARSEAVYVLHCFRKQSARTETHDIEIATKRFKAIGR
jgi:phage-related protein